MFIEEKNKGFVRWWTPDSFPLCDLGKGLSGPLMQLKSGTRVNLNALSQPKQIGDEGRIGLLYILKKIIGYIWVKSIILYYG